jgi:hypothetical protein
MVTLIPEWPIISCTTLGCSPPASISVAKLWRRAWKGMSGSPARRSRGLKERAMFWQLYQVVFAQSKIRRCDYCNALIIGAREGTRFCSNSCRNKYDNHSGRRAERNQDKGTGY